MTSEQGRIEPDPAGAFLHVAGDLVRAEPARRHRGAARPRNTGLAVVFAAAPKPGAAICSHPANPGICRDLTGVSSPSALRVGAARLATLIT